MQILWMLLAMINVGMSLIFDFKNDIHNANNSMLWAIWSVVMSLYLGRRNEIEFSNYVFCRCIYRIFLWL
jgi:hypothetical protein